MALDIGELFAKLTISSKPMDKGLKEGESKLKGFGDKATKLATKFGAFFGISLVGSLLATLGSQDVGAKVAARLGDSPDAARAYGAEAGKVYAEGWGESIGEIADTLRTVAQAKLVDPHNSAALEDLTRKAQILSDVFGLEVEGSVRAVQQLIRTGLVKDATEGFDLIAKASQDGLDKSGDLLDTINEYSTEFRALGINGQQAFGLISQAVKAGARDTDTAADALKEFAIRSKDASTTSAQGFQLLGLNAQKMTAQFARGGPEAAAGLQLVLDRLRAIKDPVKQNTAAVDLFGTKAEDLGKSLYAMNLAGAANDFGTLAGSVDKAGQAVKDTPTAKLEVFKREIQNAAISLAADLIPSLEKMGAWVQRNAGWVKPLAEGVAALAIAITAVNLAQKAWAATTAAWTAVTEAATAVEWLFSAALWASPITWIVLAIVALVAIIVLIATKTDWFQKLWAWAWGGIKTAALATWNWIRNTLWPGIKTVFEAIGAAAVWLWKNAIKPAWDGIVVAIQFAWRIISSIFALMGWAWITFVAKPILWGWQNLIWPAFQGIAMIATWLWSTILKPAFDGVAYTVGIVGAAFMWLYTNAILPAIQGIGAAAMWLWNNAIWPAFQGIGAAAKWLWNSVLSPLWNGIVSAATWVGNTIRDIFSKVGGWIGGAFSSAVGIVRGAMNGIISAINGAISGINWVIDKANTVPGVDFPHIPQIPHLATGGTVQPRAGGTPVVMGDGGEVEYGVPDSAFQRYVRDAVAAGGGHAEILVQVELVGDGVLKIVRTKVKREGLKTLEQTP